MSGSGRQVRYYDPRVQARIVCDYKVSGATLTARLWGMSRTGVYDLVHKEQSDPEFAKLCAQVSENILGILDARRNDVHLALQNAILSAARRQGNGVRDLVDGLVQVMRAQGMHKGDKQANRAKITQGESRGSGASISLPVILTQPRLEPAHAELPAATESAESPTESE